MLSSRASRKEGMVASLGGGADTSSPPNAEFSCRAGAWWWLRRRCCWPAA